MGYTEDDIKYMMRAIIKAHDSLPAYDTLEGEAMHEKGGLMVASDFLLGLLGLSKEGKVFVCLKCADGVAPKDSTGDVRFVSECPDCWVD